MFQVDISEYIVISTETTISPNSSYVKFFKDKNTRFVKIGQIIKVPWNRRNFDINDVWVTYIELKHAQKILSSQRDVIPVLKKNWEKIEKN